MTVFCSVVCHYDVYMTVSCSIVCPDYIYMTVFCSVVCPYDIYMTVSWSEVSSKFTYDSVCNNRNMCLLPLYLDHLNLILLDCLLLINTHILDQLLSNVHVQSS